MNIAAIVRLSVIVASVGVLALLVGPGCDKQEARAPGTNVETPVPTAPAKVANIRCPIMPGSTINPERVPAKLTRTFEGQKIGFCCGGCPEKWDDLTDDAKHAKLASALPKE